VLDVQFQLLAAQLKRFHFEVMSEAIHECSILIASRRLIPQHGKKCGV
jgi:hypothetical protein